MKKLMKVLLKLFVVVTLLAGAIASAISAVWTLIPESTASKVSMLGYKSHCTFAPISTILLLFITVVFSYIVMRTKFLKLYR